MLGTARENVQVVNVKRANTILYCERWAEVVEFYRDRLGLEVVFENDWFVEFAVGPDGFVSIADAARSSVRAGDGAGLTLSLQVDDVAATRSTLMSAGVLVSEVGSRWGAAVIDVFDPAGNRIEFWSENPESGADGAA